MTRTRASRQRGVAQLDALRSNVRVVVLDLSRVPIIDASGLVALESALERLNRTKRVAILEGPYRSHAACSNAQNSSATT